MRHHFEDREIGQKELPDNDIITGDPAFLEKEPEADPEDETKNDPGRGCCCEDL